MNNIKLTIGDNRYDINPQLTLGEYMDIQKNKESLEDPLKLMSHLTSIPEEDLRKIDQNKATIIADKILSKKIKKYEEQVQSTFEFKGITYGLETDLTKINFGGWVDLETFIALSHHEHLDKITAIFYRPVIGQIGKKYFLEEYDSDSMIKRAEVFKDLPFEIVSGAQRFFFGVHKTIYNKYNTFFDYEDKEDEEENESRRYDEQDTPQIPSWETCARFYYQQIMILADEDITKMDEVLKYSVIKCFNYLSYIKDKKTREMNAIKRAREKTRTVR